MKMVLQRVAWAWSASRQLDAGLMLRAKFITAAIRRPDVSKELAEASPASPLGKLLSEWPQTVGLLVWPYQSISWNAETRFRRLNEHLRCVQEIPGLQLLLGEKLVLADLSAYSPGVSLILDRAEWLSREGHLTLSIFKQNFRSFSVSFSLFGYPQTELFIGGIQGRLTDDALALYRDLTKDFQGIRPRDLILESLRLFAIRIGVRHIYAVADQYKISRHKYFGTKKISGLFYDDVWRDRSGEQVAETHFELPLMGSRRSLDEVPAKKRSMYRRRYQMLDEIESILPVDLAQAERRHFDAT